MGLPSLSFRMSLVLAALVAVQLPAAMATCSFESNGDKWDFRKLTKVDYLGLDGYYHYSLRVCGKSRTPSDCANKDGSFCVLDKDTEGLIGAVGKWDVEPLPVWEVLNGDPSAGVSVTYTNGEQFSGRPAKVVLQLKCDYSATNPHPDAGAYDVTLNAISTTFTVAFKTEWGCANHLPSEDDGDTGLSGGSIFLIILVVVVPIYIVAGCVYKQQRLGTKGVENCPNIDFWRAIPGLVKDGCKYSWRKTSAAIDRMRSGSGTEKIPETI